ncbi:MAG: hypothetical protein M3N19_09850 [Candidatus Eremiobacteraeota bacterium]|nr:hypothetical protein [Candidatus Eremiobacteraeota bacterium]
MQGIAVGVDAGGTSTTASYSKDGVFCTAETTQGASATALGVDEAARRIIAAIEALIPAHNPASIYIGAAGAGRPEVAHALETQIATHYRAAQVRVSDDAHIAVRACVPEGAAMVLIAGTGSIAYAENESQESFRAGGFGFLLGDDGSGFALGLAAAKLLLRVYDGRAAADELTREVESRLGVQDAPELVRRVYGKEHPVALLAALAQPVITLASNGVRSAQKLVQSAALELSDLVKVVARKAGLTGVACPLVLAGGLLRENSMLSFVLETRLQADLPSIEILKRAAEPHRGALAAAEALLPS